MLMVAAGGDLLEAENVLVEAGGLLQVGHLHGDVDDARFLASVLFLVTPDADDLGEVAVGSAELERALLPVRENAAAVLLDLLGGGLAFLDLDPDVMHAGTRAGELRLLLLLAVIDHEGEIDIAVGHVPGGMAAGMPGLGLIDA